MNFSKFSVDTTNIFPMANTTKGGQLATEFNLTARESVASAESIKYKCGPSYVHAEEDFYVSALTPIDDFFPNNTRISTSILQIAPGKGVIDGRYVENLVPMVIDLAAVNTELVEKGDKALSGNLAVGLRIMYSTLQTMAGSVDATVGYDDGDEYFEGIQVVILPVDELLLPTSKFTNSDGKEIDCGLAENEHLITAHLLLATFSYFNGNISNVINNYPNKCQMLPACRIGEINNVISGEFLKKTGLNEKKLYVLAGKGRANDESEQDTWCDATDSMIVWDSNVSTTNDADTISGIEQFTQADFITDGKKVKLVLPHKQIDGETTGYDMENANGERVVFVPRIIDLPLADFGSGAAGTVDKNYTNCIKDITNKINNIYQLTNGKQILYIDELGEDDELPIINDQWDIGDYILVGKNYKLSNEYNTEQGIAPPASMYVILPGKITEITVSASNGITKPSGVELERIFKNEPPVLGNDESSKQTYNSYWNLPSDDTTYRGVVSSDYFTYVYVPIKDDGSEGDPEYYYYVVSATDGKRSYSPAIQITSQIPFASESTIGGFLNVNDSGTYLDGGYVILDGDGHLRLLDYALLRSGTLAYQLGEDFSVPSGQSAEEVQGYLDEYVNQRIAFPNIKHTQTADNPNIIDITLNLSPSEEDVAIDIYDIDSRFQTAVRINILGSANDKITINISDCARVIINPQISGTPKINLYRSCLYYDYEVLERLSKIMDMTLWYVKLHETDPSILVDGMTVKLADETGLITSDYNIISKEFWSTENINDFHFKVALQSLTFSSSGYIVGCGVLIGNDSTVNIKTGKFVIHDTEFEIPQGPNTLRFPKNRLVSTIAVTGQFITCYRDMVNNQYNIQNTSFSLKTPHYKIDADGMITGTETVNGEIAFFVDSFLMNAADPEIIDVWEPGTFHLFNGSAIY